MALVASVHTGQAAVITLDFEGLGSLETVNDFYNGGSGSNYGISFDTSAIALIDSDAGGTGNFGGEPSPDTVLFFQSSTAATMSVAAGFDTDFSFYYSAAIAPGSITVYDGENGTGNVLTTLVLPVTPSNGAPDPTGVFSPFIPIGVSFSGVAKSVDFGGSAGLVAFDNITLNDSVSNAPVPEPGNILGLAMIVGAGMLARRR